MSKEIEKWCRKNNINIAGQLPFDTQMVEAMVQGESITEYNAELNISKRIKIIWNKILNQKK
jgi:MinD superfamily P-loop ATPase